MPISCLFDDGFYENYYTTGLCLGLLIQSFTLSKSSQSLFPTKLYFSNVNTKPLNTRREETSTLKNNKCVHDCGLFNIPVVVRISRFQFYYFIIIFGFEFTLVCVHHFDCHLFTLFHLFLSWLQVSLIEFENNVLTTEDSCCGEAWVEFVFIRQKDPRVYTVVLC